MRRFIIGLAGNVLGSIANLAFLIVLARQVSPELFGKALFLVALSSVIPVAVDTASLQLVTQRARPLGLKPNSIDQWLELLLLPRAILIGAIIAVQTCFFSYCGLIPVDLFGLCFLTLSAVSLSAALINQLAQEQKKDRFLVAQFLSVLGAIAAGALSIFSIPTNLASTLLLIFISRFPVLLAAIRFRKNSINLPNLVKLVRTHPRTSSLLLLTQSVAALSSYLDGILAASFGYRVAADYQLVQRPMLALGIINVSLGQESTARNISGLGVKRSRALAVGLLGGILGGVFGFLVYLIVPILIGREFMFAIDMPIIIGLAFGLSSATALLGPQVLMSKKTNKLLFSAAGQVVIVVIFFYSLTPFFGISSLAYGVLGARIFATIVQLQATK